MDPAVGLDLRPSESFAFQQSGFATASIECMLVVVILTKWRPYRDHRFCDVTSACVYATCRRMMCSV